MNLADLMNQLADEVDTRSLPGPDEIRRTGDRLRLQRRARLSVGAAVAAVLAVVAAISLTRLDARSTPEPIGPTHSHGVPGTWPSDLPIPDGKSKAADFPGGTYDIRGVAASDSVYVAAAGSGRNYSRTSFWFSADGLHWREATLVDPDDGPLNQASVSVNGVVATSDGRFVAAGRSETLGPVVWTSTDGQTWVPHRAQGSSPFARERDFNIVQLYSAGGRLLGIGSPCCGYGHILWISDDQGRTWQSTDTDYFGGESVGGTAICRITGDHGELTLAAVHPHFRGASASFDAVDDVTWTSTDGLHWTQQSSVPSTRHSPYCDQASFWRPRYATGPAGVLLAPLGGLMKLWPTAD